MMKTITKERTMLFKSMLLLGLFLTVFSFGKIRAQALSGNYTIGSGGTYANIAAALADLNTNGVNGPVTMTILPGTYSVTSTISINNYTGVGASNPLVFEGTDVDSVIFQGTVNSGSIFLLNLNKYVTLRKLTVINNSSTNCSGIAIRGNTSSNIGSGHTINNCKVSIPFSSTSYTSMGILTTAAASGYGTGGNTYCDSLNIDSNTITGAYYGLYLYGRTTLGNTGNREVKIRNNNILDSKYYGMYVYYHQNGLEILNNKVSVNSSAYYGMYIYYCYNHHTGNNPHRIINNQVYNAAYGMYLYNFTAGASNPSQVYNNTLIGRAGIYNYGIYIFTGTTYAGHLNVYHNTSYMLNSTYGYAFYHSGNYAGNAVRVMNNIFALGTTSSGYYAAYFATSPANPAGGQAINNNIYYSTGASAANLMYRGGAYNASNFNTATAGGDSSYVYLPKYSSDGHMFDACNKLGSPIGSFYVPTDRDGQARSVTSPLIGSDEAASLSNNIKVEQILQPGLPMVSGAQDVKAIVKNVGSNTVTSFTVSYTLNNGTPVTQYFTGSLAACDTVSVLFTGSNQITLGSNNSIKVYTESPNSSTDADATDDTLAIILKAPLSGLYTIGTGGDYSTFQAAVADLANGVAGPVIFKVLPGSYSGQVVISGQIPGASSTNTITFEGDTASTRILSASVSGAAVFLVNQANYVNIRHLTINNTSTGGVGVAIVGTAGNNYGSNCSIVGNIINMPYQTATSYNISVTATLGGNGTSACRNDSITIDSNICTGGYYGISAYGASNGTYNYNFKFRNNTISNMYYMGMNLYYLYNAVDLIGNSVSMPTTSSTVYYGIYMYYCANPTSTPTNIIGNNVNGGYYYQYYIYNTGSSPLNVINNVGGRTTYGYNNGMYLYATTASSATILHNTLTQDYPQSGATYSPFAAYLPSNSIVKNNIFANTATTGTQTPCYLYSAPTASNSINNNIYFNGASTSAIYRGSAYTSSTFNTPLAGGDSSIFVNPKFISNTNYQVTTCYTGGDYTSIVGTDIMGAIRNVPPKIGAYENTTPLSYLSSNTVQMTGLVAPGATDFPVLRIPVAFTGCGDGYTTNFYFNTVGTTSASNIVAAKIYNSGVSAGFNTSNLVGTVYSPSGAFSFTVSDTVNRNFGDTTNYWLAYDVSSSASNGNTLDARIDSFTVLGSSFVPANNNPTGNLVVASPMTYLGSTASHPKTTYVTPGSSNNEILKIAVITSSTGSPISATSFSLNTTGGGNDTLNISSAKLYYTGNSSTFSTSTLFGSYSVSSPTTSSWPTYAITGSQQLANDTNYFWLAYDIYSGASLGDSVDAQVTSISVGGSSQTPTVTAPSGYRKIRADYCISSATSTADEEIWNVTFGTLNNTTSCTSTTGGPGTVARMYSNFTALAAPAIPAGLATPFSVLTSSCGGNYTSHLVIYIDYNQDGYFTGTGEMAYSSGSFGGSTAGILKSGTITVPCTALAGETRMRVIYVETSAVPASCGTYTWGETEDYTINIVSGLPSLISAGAVQVSGSTSAGATDVPVMRVPIKVTSSPCNPGVITELTFNTAGTTSASDIVSAKLYKTGNSATFTNTNLLGTIYTPSGSMVFSINDTTVNDTNNYWLAYDISSSAANANVVDARFDSANVFGTYGVPAN
ncbi:MAG: hypothetical protein K9I36_05870, partial [Bacteroidia bacterium]|nr:hypothetical protein [Bacteroidia bacterium]MCF8426237.1 hypothetical protein [Bacteroidia bacterium]